MVFVVFVVVVVLVVVIVCMFFVVVDVIVVIIVVVVVVAAGGCHRDGRCRCYCRLNGGRCFCSGVDAEGGFAVCGDSVGDDGDSGGGTYPTWIQSQPGGRVKFT